ncbi:MAG: substrate-binding domain-containing protein [Propionibacteriaceae bacterium]|nr:substrate-binding domain-containing protein [Propionibacteriaceae bacterium]
MNRPHDRALIGLALVRPAEIMGAEPYFHELVAGVERVTLPRGHAMLLRVLSSREDESETYRRWAEEGQVGAVLLADLRVDDERLGLVEELGLPAVVIGPPGPARLTSVWTDDDEVMKTTVRQLAAMGHEAMLHVGGPSDLMHSRRRRRAFVEECERLDVRSSCATGDYSRASGVAAIETALDAPGEEERPSVVVFDSDLMALGGLGALQARQIPVPHSVALVSWEDSAICQLADPPLTALAHNARAVGRMVGEAILETIAGAEPRALRTAQARLVERGTTSRVA